MAVAKAVDLVGSGATIEGAISEAIDRAIGTLEAVTDFKVRKISGEVEDSGVTYRVKVRVWFTLLERMHG